MNLPFLNKNQDEYYYPEEGDKKKKIIMYGGIAAIVLLGMLLLFGGDKGAGGQLSLQQSLESTNEALGIIEDYQTKLNYAPTKNDVANIQLILRGNYQKLSGLYEETYDGKGPSETPKADEESIEKLDRASRNNTIDTDIITVLKSKIEASQSLLEQTVVELETGPAVKVIKDSIKDYDSVLSVLERPR